MLDKYQAFVTSPNKRLRNVAATILILSLGTPAMAQSTFPEVVRLLPVALCGLRHRAHRAVAVPRFLSERLARS